MQSIAVLIRERNNMSMYITVSSVCGRTSTSVDVYDLPTDVTCCNECNSILICRNAWNDLYN